MAPWLELAFLLVFSTDFVLRVFHTAYVWTRREGYRFSRAKLLVDPWLIFYAVLLGVRRHCSPSSAFGWWLTGGCACAALG